MGGEGERQGARQGGAAAGADALLEALKRVLEFRALFAKIARRGIPGAILDGLLRKKFRASKRGVGDAEIAAAVAEAAGELPGWSAQLTGGRQRRRGRHPRGAARGALQRGTCSSRPTTPSSSSLHADIAGLHKGPCTIVDASRKRRRPRASTV